MLVLVQFLALGVVFTFNGRLIVSMEKNVMGMEREISKLFCACPKLGYVHSGAIQCPGVSYVVP